MPGAILAAASAAAGTPALPTTGASLLAGPFAAAAGLLAGAGAAKLARPTWTVGALRASGLPLGSATVRAFATGEVVVGAGALAFGGPALAALVAVSYLAFAVFVASALVRRLPVGTCGCFGRPDTPPHLVHVVLNTAAAAVAGAAAVGHPVGLLATLRHQPLWGAPFLVLTAVATYATYLAMTLLPAVVGAAGMPRRVP